MTRILKRNPSLFFTVLSSCFGLALEILHNSERVREKITARHFSLYPQFNPHASKNTIQHNSASKKTIEVFAGFTVFSALLSRSEEFLFIIDYWRVC